MYRYNNLYEVFVLTMTGFAIWSGHFTVRNTHKPDTILDRLSLRSFSAGGLLACVASICAFRVVFFDYFNSI